jgi:hypothetical protein
MATGVRRQMGDTANAKKRGTWTCSMFNMMSYSFCGTLRWIKMRQRQQKIKKKSDKLKSSEQ